MAQFEAKKKTTVYFLPKTWTRLLEHIVKKYGRAANVASLEIDQAVNFYLDSEESPPAE